MSSEFDAIVIGAGPAGEVCAGELVSEARQAPGAKQAIAAPIDVAQALAWRDFMISDWDDADKVDCLGANHVPVGLLVGPKGTWFTGLR